VNSNDHLAHPTTWPAGYIPDLPMPFDEAGNLDLAAFAKWRLYGHSRYRRIDQWQRDVDAIGLRVAAHLVSNGFRGLQLHPRDTGGTLLEINWSDGGAVEWPRVQDVARGGALAVTNG